MNNKRYTYYLLLLLPTLMLSSCTQEDMPIVADGADAEIVFRVSLTTTDARSASTTEASSLNSRGFHVSAFCPEDNAEPDGTFAAYFTEQYAKPLGEGCFGIFDQSLPEEEQCVWPSVRRGKQGKLKFFAFYPSRQALWQSAGVEEEESDDYFKLSNYSKKNGSEITYDFRMEKFKVHTDITRHIDFVTATAEGSKIDNGDTGVRLDFEHQLSRIALTA